LTATYVAAMYVSGFGRLYAPRPGRAMKARPVYEKVSAARCLCGL